MGYETIVWGYIKIKPSHANQVKSEIADANKQVDNPKFEGGIAEFVADTQIEETNEGLFLSPNPQTMKWVCLDEYIAWLEQHLESGYIEWRGEELDDIGGFKWENGKKYWRELVWTEMPEWIPECIQ